jgi:hypothetical protein
MASSAATGYGAMRKEGSFGSGAGSAYNTSSSSMPAASGSRFGRLAQFGMNQGTGQQAPSSDQSQPPNSLVGYGRHKY